MGQRTPRVGGPGDPPARPFPFLVSTTGCPLGIRAHLASVAAPAAVAPAPLAPEHCELPAWAPAHSWSTDCRHLAWGAAPPPGVGVAPSAPQAAAPGCGAAGRVETVWRAARRGYGRVRPRL